MLVVQDNVGAVDRRIATPEGDDSHALCGKLHDVDLATAEDVQGSEPLGVGMSNEGRNEMDESADDKIGSVLPWLKYEI